MSAKINYPYLLAVYALCIDGQLHQNEIKFIDILAKDLEVDADTLAMADLIIAQSKDRINIDEIINNIPQEQHLFALKIVLLVIHYDGMVDRSEHIFIDRIKKSWGITDIQHSHIQEIVEAEIANLLSNSDKLSRNNPSRGAKVLNGLESIFGQKFIDRIVVKIGTESFKDSVKQFRIEALLSGPQYDKAIEKCRHVGLHDIEIADKCLYSTEESLKTIMNDLNTNIEKMRRKIGTNTASAAKEVLNTMISDRDEIERLVKHELQELQELQIKKRRAINYYSIAFMGRSKAGKSTLHAVVTGGGWDQIGVGRQNTTRLNRVYEWHNIRIIDTPGIATPGGEELEKIAETIIDEADLICFVVTNNNQQKSEFEFLKHLRKKGKPLLVLLNVKEDISHPVRLKRFLSDPSQAFSDDKDRLGGHIDRIRRDASEYYGTENFPIIPVQLLAAQIAQQQPDHEHAEALMKSSRLQCFLDSVRLSLLDEGVLRRSQNLLGSTVSDIERPCHNLKKRSSFYLDFSKKIRNRSSENNRRLKKSHEAYIQQLEQEIRTIFSGLKELIIDFAEDHWEDSQDILNNAWVEETRKFGVEEKIKIAQEKVLFEFTNEIIDLLDEVGREFALHRTIAMDTVRLDEQDSSVWAELSKWGGGLIGLTGAVLALLAVPGGGILIGVGVILNILSSLFESKASKRRKAVDNITKALESQIDNQEKQTINEVLEHFRQQCKASEYDLSNYFSYSAQRLEYLGRVLNRGAELLEEQSHILNIHFAARVLDFAGKSPSESTAQEVRKHIKRVSRMIGERIEITVSSKLKIPKDLIKIESIIQEDIILNTLGNKS